MPISISDIQIFLDNYGVALSLGDVAKLANAWSETSIVANDDTSILVEGKKQIEECFKNAIARYQTNGITTTKPVVNSVVQISENLVAVEVNWELFAHDGTDRGCERTYYVIRQHKKDHLGIDFYAPISR